MHGDLGQGAREQALRAFRSGKVDVLVATDVAARGIDIDGVTHVINYTCPEDEKMYLHRVGRTARAGNDGVAITFVDWGDLPRWSLINKALGLAFADPPETYSTSDWMYTALGIPKNATGVLPRAARTRAGLEAETIEDLGETGKARRSGSGVGPWRCRQARLPRLRSRLRAPVGGQAEVDRGFRVEGAQRDAAGRCERCGFGRRGGCRPAATQPQPEPRPPPYPLRQPRRRRDRLSDPGLLRRGQGTGIV